MAEAGPVEAILFTADPGFPLYRPEPPMEELADMLACAVGHIGTMAEYLLNTVTELERAGVHDLHLWRLQEMVAERLEPLPDRLLTMRIVPVELPLVTVIVPILE